VIADCDAGYGNALNVMHMVRRYESAGIAGVSIEDKNFPKVNSFVPGRQELCPVDEFCGKIEAAKNAQRTRDFVVIARIEALIAGHGMAEALLRADAYADAGADAVVIHAKGSSSEPVLEFMRSWRRGLPVVVIPTTYHTITAQELGTAGAKVVIYANHGLRAGINAMAQTFDTILAEGRSTGIEDRIAPLATVFDLQGMAKLTADEERYVRTGHSRVRAVVTPGAPVPALRTSIPSEVHEIIECGILDAPPDFPGRTLVGAQDVAVDADPLRWLATATADVAVLVDLTADRAGGVAVTLDSALVGGRRFGGRGGHLVTAFGGDDGEVVPVASFSAKGFAALREVAEKRESSVDATLTDLLADLLDTGWPVRAVGVAGGWAQLRSAEDLRALTGETA
jgi:phosphoenolpyruvate phosphomutase